MSRTSTYSWFSFIRLYALSLFFLFSFFILALPLQHLFYDSQKCAVWRLTKCQICLHSIVSFFLSLFWRDKSNFFNKNIFQNYLTTSRNLLLLIHTWTRFLFFGKAMILLRTILNSYELWKMRFSLKLFDVHIPCEKYSIQFTQNSNAIAQLPNFFQQIQNMRALIGWFNQLFP